jgi:hypothetical protein
MKGWFITAAIGVALFAASAALLAGSLWLITEFVDDKEVRLAAAFVFGLAFLLTIISAIVAAFRAMELTNPKSPLGLPEGSIRAIIALVLILIFVVLSVYLVGPEAETVGESETETGGSEGEATGESGAETGGSEA